MQGVPRRRFSTAILLIVLPGVLVAGFLSARQLGRQYGEDLVGPPKRWPGNVIRYHDPSRSAAVDAAAGQWNDAGLGVRFQRTPDRDRADVLVVASPEQVADHCEVQPSRCPAVTSHAGFIRRETPSEVWVLDDASRQREPRQVRIMVHEFGHVLGLDHRAGTCTVMHPLLNDPAGRCGETETGTRPVCGPWPSDIEQAALLYGRRGRSHVQVHCLTRTASTRQ